MLYFIFHLQNVLYSDLVTEGMINVGHNATIQNKSSNSNINNKK